VNRIASVVTAAAATGLALATVGAFALTSGISWNHDDDDEHEEHEWAERNGLLESGIFGGTGTTLPAAGAASPSAGSASSGTITRQSREDRERREHEEHEDDDDD